MNITRKHLFTILAFTGMLASAHAALITNGDLETSVSNFGDNAGDSEYSLDASNNVFVSGGSVPNGDTGLDANEWVSTSLSRAFNWSATGGNGGTGGFVADGNAGNEKPRAVGFFADDGGATTGIVDISIDIFLSQASQFMQVELWGWDNGETGPELSWGGPDANLTNYNVTTLNDATSLLAASADTATLDTWTTVDLGSVDLGTGGYDHYAWRIGIVGSTSSTSDGYAFDNVTVAPIPEPSSLALMAVGLGACLLLRRRRS
jgi:hypothetical protein